MKKILFLLTLSLLLVSVAPENKTTNIAYSDTTLTSMNEQNPGI